MSIRPDLNHDASAFPLRAAWGIFMLAGLAAAGGCSTWAATAQNAEGVQLFQMCRFHEAMEQFQEAAYEDPTNADAYYNIAATHHRLARVENRPGELTQAESAYNQCLDRDPNHTDCYRGLAVLLMETGRTKEAFQLVEGWAGRQPGLADPKIELARLQEELGNREAAKDHLLEALAVEPNNPRALTALGKIREESGDRCQALANYQRSLSHDPNQPCVASRVAALQGCARSTTTTSGPRLPARSEMASGPANPLR